MTELILSLILLYASKYGVDPDLAQEIAYLESGYDPLAIGDEGDSWGVYQFQVGTWRWVREDMGRDPALWLRLVPAENIETAMYAMGEMGLYEHWTAWHIIEARKEARRGQAPCPTLFRRWGRDAAIAEMEAREEARG